MNIKAFSIFLLFTKVATVVSSASQCEDSTLYFKVHRDSWSCDMVRNHTTPNTEAFLSAFGNLDSGYVRNHCPATYGVKDCSGIQSDMHFPVLLQKPSGSGNYEDVWDKCSWASKGGPYIACDKCEKEGVRGTCPVTCPDCPTTPGPSCQDSPLPFTYDQKKLNCDIVKNAPADFCDLGGDFSGAIINTHCPVACSVDNCTGQETNMYFEILISGVLKWKQCSWVMGRGENCATKCERSGVAETCPASCAQCHSNN